MTVTESVKRAALFVADVLRSVNLRPFLKKHNIKNKNYGKRLIDKLSSTYSLLPAPRKGRPRVYTPDQLQAAQEELTKPSGPIHSRRELMVKLKDDGELPTAAKVRGFGPALDRHLAEQGLHLGYGVRSKGQPISEAIAADRLKWCKEMRPLLADEKVKDWWFEDEKPHGYGGKSRCECPVVAGVPIATPVLCPIATAVALGRWHSHLCFFPQ